VAVLPGIYGLTGQEAIPEIRVAALRLYEPKAVLTHEAAARLLNWSTGPLEVVTAAVPRTLPDWTGYCLVKRRIPSQLVTEVRGVRVTCPALTALDLGADAIDHALLTDEVSLADLRQALDAIPRQRGNKLRRQLLDESSTEPWSRAERELHKLLRGAGIVGWQGNVTIAVGESDYVIDVVFRAARLAIEVDGRHFHGDATFEHDRWKQNNLVLADWRVLRFTWAMIEKHPELVLDMVRAAVELAGRGAQARGAAG
jgi:very-short-patch-repair endonuclease